MTASRITLTTFGSAVAAAFLVLVGAMASTVLAIATDSTAGVPGLVISTAGDGAELASTQFVSPGSALWFVGLTAALTAASTATQRRRARRRTMAGLRGLTPPTQDGRDASTTRNDRPTAAP
jgi:hypothetical protein